MPGNHERTQNLARIRTPAKNIYIYIFFAWLVDNKGNPKKAKKKKKGGANSGEENGKLETWRNKIRGIRASSERRLTWRKGAKLVFRDPL